ncbi:hypothetical protein MRB53_028770 [Persea americana]|uniref:Uncharacterized protein n=1 Tax=Persea americana TaxID=3435 RepID=A0ACC2KGV5_PERAE|nr:hypothetical protein MRB53_028770 [Persea americana]
MCTLELRGPVFVLTLTGAGEHHLHSIQSALRCVTTAGGKFFSNGFDLSWAVDSHGLKAQVDRRRPLFALDADRRRRHWPCFVGLIPHTQPRLCGDEE